MADRVVGLLLAAGQGTRFDPRGQRLKLLERLGAPFHCTVAEAAARSLSAACDGVVAVVRPAHTPNQQQLHALLAAAGCELAINNAADRGMGHSLALGVKHLIHLTAAVTGCVIALADMPYISAATIAQVADALRCGHNIAAPTYEDRRGHPVGFAASWFDALSHLDGEQGARAVLEQGTPHLVAVDDPGIERDLDTPLHFCAHPSITSSPRSTGRELC